MTDLPVLLTGRYSMRIEAVGAGGATVVAPPLPQQSAAARRPNLTSAESARARWTQLIGRSILGLPASTWLLVDLAILGTGVYVAYGVFPPPAQLTTPHIALWQAAAVYAFSVICASLVFGLYERETIVSRSRTLTRMFLTTGTAAILAYAIIYVVMYSTVSRRVSAINFSIFFVGGVGIRLAAWWVVDKVHSGLLVVGPRALYESFERAQADGLLHEYRLVGYASTEGAADESGPREFHLGSIADRVPELGRMGVTDIVVGDAASRGAEAMSWIAPSLQRGCRVTNEAIFYEKATGQILVDGITPSWFLFADLEVHCDEQATLKRLSDLVVASIGLILTAPLWPIIALMIRLADGGPAFYSQERVGQNGRPFRLFKFRTMRLDAESGNSVWATPNDPRVTRVGRFLRRTRLDELPQLYNVLIGKMSVVGPRPERPDIVDELNRCVPFYAERHLVKPGITGWAQISFRYGSTIEDAKRKLQYDLYYLKHTSFELDMMILFRTAGTFLRGAC